MPSQLDNLIANLEPITGSATTDPVNPFSPKQTTTSQLDQLISTLQPIADPHVSLNSATTPIAPQGTYNTADLSKINIDAEVTNSLLRNMWNSFKRGIDEIQISTAQGKFEYSPIGDSSAEIIDNYPDQKQDLDTQLERGLIDQGEHDRQLSSLNSSYQSALNHRAEVANKVASNQEEINNEPVSKEYQYKNWLTQTSGDQASFWDKSIYSMPQVMGSSASLMVPQLAATFGSNLTKALIRSSIAYAAGPEAGLPANAIATVGSIAISVGEILWGRAQESYGEVGSTIMENRQRLMEEYARNNGLTSIDQIPEEVQRQIRIASRKGSDTQFMENMALAASDVAQAILMPGSSLAGNIGESLGTVGKAIKSAGDYSLLTRTLRTAGKAYYGALGEKFEEGFQQAAQYRATDEALGLGKYQNKGLMANILTDAYDTASSLNYSLIPGISLRPDGRYSQDREFQFAEDSGGMLGLFMGAIPTAISVGKDFATYRTATKALAKQGVINPEDKIFRLQNSVLENYFKKDQLPYLIEAMRSLKGKKGEDGQEILSDTDFTEAISNIKEAYKLYDNVAERINGLKGDKWAFFNSKELSQAKSMIKSDLFHNTLGIVKSQKTLQSSTQNRDAIAQTEHSLIGEDQRLNPYKSLRNLVENASYIKQVLNGYLDQNLDTIPNLGERERTTIQQRVDFLTGYINNLNSQIEEQESTLRELGIDFSDSEASPELDKANKDVVNKTLDLSDYQSKYKDLLKIKDYNQAKAYYQQQSKTRQFADGSPLNSAEGAEEAEPTERGEDATDNTGDNDSYAQGYEEDYVEEEEQPIATPSPNLENLTGVAENQATPDEASYINDSVKNAFRDALDDLATDFDDTPPSKSVAERVAALEQGLTNAGLDLGKLRFNDLYRIFRDNFADDLDYVRNKFELLRAITQAYKAERGATPTELKQIRTVELDPETMLLSDEAREFNTPPEQTPDAVELANRDIITSAKKEEAVLEQGAGLKIVSGLSLATKNIVSGRTSTGEVGDFRESGQIQFVEDTDQQLVNTNFVSVGDEVTLRINSLPEGFNLDTASEDDYDLVNIEVYKTVKQDTPNGQIEKQLLIGSLHRVQKLPELLAESADLDEEVKRLHSTRVAIIHSDSREFKATVTNKGFGFLNRNNRQLQVPINSVFGQDSRVHISTVAASGQAIETRDGLTYSRGITPLIPGATVAFVPNETRNGTLYVPLYLTKQQLKRNESILNKVTASITEFLKTGSRKFMTDAEQYVYITREPEESPGLKGVFWNYIKEGNVPYVNINGKRYTMKNVVELKSALSNVYFTPNRNALSKVPGYEQEIMNSGLLTTNIQNNKVISSRFSSGEYRFLQASQQNQYFSQHTIELGNFQEVKASESNPVSKQTEPQSTDVKAEISRLRAERVQKAKDMGFAVEGGKGSLRNTYEAVLAYLNDPEVLMDQEANSSDIIAGNEFVAMYDEYEERIEELKRNNNTEAPEETTIAPKADAESKQVWYQGYSGRLDSREFNYFASSEQEAKDYGSNVRAVTIQATNTLDYYNSKMLSQYQKDTNKRFDLLDNSPEGLQEQSDFFQYVKNKGYDSIKFRDQYFVTLTNSIVTNQTTSEDNSITGAEFTEQENQDVTDELTKMGIDLDFDDLVGSIEVAYDTAYKSNLNAQIGLKNTLGARYSDQEVEYIREAINRFNRENGTNHQMFVARIGGQNAITVTLQTQFSVDDISVNAPSLASKLLVSKDISATLQNQMVDSIAYKLLTNEKPDATQTEAEEQDNSNKSRVKKSLEDTLAKFKVMITKPNTPEILTKLQTLIDNYGLMVTHYDGLYDKALEVLNKLGFESTDENSDYFENLEEHMEDNNATQFNDDSNSTRNQKNFLPAEVKKLLYFIPDLQERDLSDPKQVADMENPKSEYYNKPYKAKPNALGLPSFNDFNDTWEKTLSIISQRTYSSDNSGFNEMLRVLQKEQNPIIVKELATRLQKANDQVKNAFFRRTYLQKQQNKTTIVNYRNNKSWKDKDGVWHQGTTTKTTQVINSDQRQGIRFIATQLEQEFRINAAQNGLLTNVIEESTGRSISTINVSRGKELLEQLRALIDDNNNYAVERQQIGNVKAKVSSKFTDQAKAKLLEIINSTGMNLSYGGLSDLLKYYKPANSQYTGDERAVALEVFQNTIFKRFAGLQGTNTTANQVQSEEEIQGDIDYEINNPFKKDPSTIQSIARYEFAYRVQNQSGSYRAGGKSYYPFTRHSYLSEMITDMTAWLKDRVRGESGEKNVFAKLRNDHFAQESIYLQAIANPVKNPEFAKIFKLRYALDTRNRAALDSEGKLLQDMTEREHQISKLVDFQNSGNRAAVMHYDTLSDKITKPVIDVLRQDVMYATETQTIDAGNIALTENTMNNLYRYFLAEHKRIKDVTVQNKTLEKHQLIKGYHDIGNKEGMGKYFNIYYFLNKPVLDVDNPELSKNLYNTDGTLKDVTPDIESQVKDQINMHFNRLFSKTKEDFRNLGLFDLENRNARKEFDPLIQDMVDSNYLRKNAIKLGLENVKGIYKGEYYRLSQIQLNRIIDFAIVDYVVNYSIFSNEMLMFTGDPAQAGKVADKGTISAIKAKYPDDEANQRKYTAIANVESTFVNVGKRNAAFLGSGEKGKFNSSQYSVAIANDQSIDSPQFTEYKSLFKGNEAAVERAYRNGDLTDAQEVTTVEEHLHTMMAFGQITEPQYRKFLYIYDRNHYSELFPGKSENITSKDRFEAYGIVMQPMKPVQRTYNVDDQLHISKQYYIKTSSYPLVPELIVGTPMEDLLKDMKKNKVQRVAFVSATKQGVAGSKDLVKDGVYNKSFLENNQNTLERDGFRIQLEVPYKDSKDEIREGTQLSKLLFVDIPEDLIMSYQGKQTKVSELKQKYNDYHRKIVEYKTNQLLDELGVTKEANGELNLTNLSKLARIIQEEGIGRGYSINALLGLDLNTKGQFKIPLTFLPNTGQIQPVLTAIVSNRIARLKMPGKSYVQGSEFILNRGNITSDVDSVDKRNIVWTKPEYSGTSKLKYLREESGKVKPAQIIMPFYFIDSETKKRVDLRQYTRTDEQGRVLLDTSRIDPELLEMNGFRIPFQGHNSGMWFEIIGFLPYEMGDLIIVPGEIAAQMGSDYDVDKLYAYMYNYKLSESKLSKIKSTDPTEIEEYQNALIDIHKAIFTSKEMFGPILDPLSFADVEEAISELGSEESKEFLGAFDPTYQRDVYFSNRGGQLGVGITANANTSHSLSQTTNLFIKRQGIVFLDEEGNEYVDRPNESDTNRVNEYTAQTYTYREDGETKNQNDGSQNSAWRLDKIFTFTNNPKTGQPYKISNLISQLLGVSVDNAKEQKLGAYGLNKHNFNVAVSIIRAGFDLITTKAFINQPILKEYYEAIGATEDMFAVDFTPNKREQAVADIFKKYGERFGIDHNAIFNRDFVKGFTLQEIRESLTQGEVTQANAQQQLEVLKAFLHYKTLSDGLQALVSAINIDTKGLPKNVSETINKQQDIEDNVYDNVMFGNTQRFVTDTIPGLFAKLPTVFEGIFANPRNPLFAYSSAAYVSAINKVQFLTGRKIVGQDKIDRFHNSIKQFLYTSNKIDTELGGRGVSQKRRELLFDYENNKSLQTKFLELRTKYPQNDLLRAINPVISEYPNDPKQLEIILSSEEDYTERIRQYWEFMLNNEEQTDLQDFSQELVHYALLVSSQEYGTSNLIKYIPFSALEHMGFGEELNRINENMFQDENLLDSFVNQFVQHELDYVLAAKEKNFTQGSVQYQTINVIENNKQVTKNTNIINKFSLQKYDPNALATNPAASLLREDMDGNWDYPEVLSVFIDSKVGKLLYQKKQNSDGTVDYYRIDTLGGNNISEYDFNANPEFAKSLIEGNRSNAVIPASNASTKRFGTKVAENQSDDISLSQKYFPSGEQTTVDILLNRIIGNVSPLEGDVSALYNTLAETIQRYNLTTPITVNDNIKVRASTSYTDEDGVTGLRFNPNLLFQGDRTGLNSELGGIRTILHELIHALTLNQLFNPAYRDSPQYKQLNSVWEAYKSAIRNNTKLKERGVNVSAFDAELFSLIVTRFKEFQGTPTRQSDIYVADMKQTVSNLLKPENEGEFTDLLGNLGRQLQELANENKLEKANYDLVSNSERLKKFRERIAGDFLNNMNDNINKYYSYYRIEEFATEALTNIETQKILKAIPSLWERFRSALAALLARILGYEKNERSLLDDAIESVIDLVELTNQQNQVQVKANSLLVNDISQFVNHSGGALGADSEWDNIGKRYGMVNNNHYYHGSKTPKGNVQISDQQLEEGWKHVLEANKTLHRRPENYKSLLSRNWFQVKNSDAIFAISSLSGPTQVSGGTGWAVQMAIDSKKPVYVFDQEKNQWYNWSDTSKKFEETKTPILTPNFAGIGTRNINNNGLKAISDVYQSTISFLEAQGNPTKTDTYQYYGATYEIQIDAQGRGINIPAYKGPKAKMQVILDAYNNNPDVDPQNGKYFRQPTKSTQTKQFGLSREYRLPSGKVISFNDQQYSGLQKISEWLANPSQQFFTLSGFAGTGKTTIVKAILDTYRNRVAVTAPTHKAKNVISRTTSKPAETVQKLLGLRPNVDLENFNPNRPQFDPLSPPKIGMYDWIIIDEASMLNKGLFNLIVRKAQESGTKVLFMGDPAQIPPVGENISDVFDSESINVKHQLDKVERQAGSNPLMSVYDRIRSFITAVTDQFDHKTKVNNQGEGIEFTKSYDKFRSEVIRNFLSNEYEQDRNYAKVIAWQNVTVTEWNKEIREALFGKNARQYEEGDTLMAYNTINGQKIVIENSSDYVVKNVTELTNHGFYGFDGFRLAIQDIDTGSKKEVFIVKNDQKNMEKYLDTYNSLLNQARLTKNWKPYYSFKENNLLGAPITAGKTILVSKDFDYGYALTAHKSQGSTYTHAFVVENDIDANPHTSGRNKIKYVAFSRPTTKVLSFSDKTVEEGRNFYIQPDDMLSTLPRDINEVSDKELADLMAFCKG